MKKSKPTGNTPDAEDLHVDIRTGNGQMTIAGTATAVIAALAVVGLILISLYIVNVAERVLERNPPSGTTIENLQPQTSNRNPRSPGRTFD
jgi:hypothetical protein